MRVYEPGTPRVYYGAPCGQPRDVSSGHHKHRRSSQFLRLPQSTGHPREGETQGVLFAKNAEEFLNLSSVYRNLSRGAIVVRVREAGVTKPTETVGESSGIDM